MRALVILLLALFTGGTALGASSAAGASGQSVPLRVDPALLERIQDAPRVIIVEQPLDMESLKQRLRDTNAIGIFSKLALRNQMDDLITLFRVHYADGQKTDIALLRQPYNMLVLKVLALLQDGDPPLARTVAASREALWRILSDPRKFKLIAQSPATRRSDQLQALRGDIT